MTEILSKFDSGELIGLFAMAGGFVCALTAIIGGILARCWAHARELAFKDELIARGLSADEIRTVMEAGSRRSLPHLGCRGADTAPYV